MFHMGFGELLILAGIGAAIVAGVTVVLVLMASSRKRN